MTTPILTRTAKGSALLWSELDSNLSTLRDAHDTFVASTTVSIGNIQAGQAGGTIGFLTKAAMDADLDHAAGVIALVTNDDVSYLNNGNYIKIGASGAGSWQAVDLPNPFPYKVLSQFGNDLANAVTTIDTDETTLLYMADITLSANLVIPANLELWPVNNAIINHGAYTISYAGPTDRWPLKQIFNGSGAVTGLEKACPEWFGITGTADQTAIQKALVASTKNKWSQQYNVSVGKIEIMYDGTHIEGTSNKLCGIKLNDNVNPDYEDYKYGIIWSEDKSNITIEDIFVDGNNTNNYTTDEWNLHNIAFTGGSNNTVRNCRSLNSNHEGVMWWESLYGLCVNNYSSGSRNSAFSNGETAPSTNGCIGWKCIDNFAFNSGYGCDGVTPRASGISSNGPHSIISGNYVDTTGLNGINIGHIVVSAGALTLTNNSVKTIVSNNTIKNVGLIGNLSSNGISVVHADDAIISNNIIDTVGGASATGAYHHGIAFIGDGSITTPTSAAVVSNRITLSDNNISNVKGSGIVAFDVDGWNIHDNTFVNCLLGTDSSQSYIRMLACTNTTIKNNKVYQTTDSGGSTKFMIFTYGTSRTVFIRMSNLTVDGNTFIDTTDTIGYIMTTTGMGPSCVFKNNKFTLGASRYKFLNHTAYVGTDGLDTLPIYKNNSYNTVLYPKEISTAVLTSAAGAIETITIPFNKNTANLRDLNHIKILGTVSGTAGSKVLTATLTADSGPTELTLATIASGTTGLLDVDIYVGYAGLTTAETFEVISVVNMAGTITALRQTFTWTIASSTTDLTIALAATLTSPDTIILFHGNIETC